MPNYALGQQVPKNDERIKASYETVPSPNGNGTIRGYFVRPFSADSRSETPAKLPGIIVIHENRGLNPHTEDVARRFALENFMAFAPDALSSVGGYPGDDYKGGQLFSKIDDAKRTQDFVAAARWLKSRPDCTGKIGATGFCYGGGMTSNLSVLLGPDLAAAAPFYGRAPKPEDVPKIKAAILIHHGALDKALSEAVSSTTRRRNATTRSRPRRHGRAPSSGSTSMCAHERPAISDDPIGSEWFRRPPPQVIASGPHAFAVLGNSIGCERRSTTL
jgi:carboxymethylenebutenolidase